MIDSQRPLVMLTHVLRSRSGLYWRVRGYGGTVGSLAEAYPMTHFEAEQRLRNMSCTTGHFFVAERLTNAISI